ncbi:MAG: anhydro-N-acetylmuramic acid kinase [Bacteroidota bacterium]
MKTYQVIGMMSGTSLDGVDIAHCTFEETEKGFTYDIGKCETTTYPQSWLDRLRNLPRASALEYAETHVAYGKYLGELIKDFVGKNHLVVDFVSSHGHTIFHNPSRHYTSQIGDGAAIAIASGFPVVCDFRSSDVAAGGQGAPLVPIGDDLLFPEFDYCLNLGGFANISMRKNDKRVAFDISPANIILNHIASQAGKAFDEDGKIAEAGIINPEFLQKLNNLPYYKKNPPKSLGREWIENEILPLLIDSRISLEDASCTFCEHIAIQIAACLEKVPGKQMLVTGGGTFNTFLIRRIAALSSVKLVIPGKKLIDFKEALVFAFLGLLRMQAKPNCLASVTGAVRDVSGGAVYLP